MIKKFPRIITRTQSKYKVTFEKKYINQQCSYNLPNEIEDYLLSLGALVAESPTTNMTNLLYGLSPEYSVKLGSNIIAIIGDAYSSKVNKVVFTHTEGANGGSKKIQLKKTDFAKKKDKSYQWFVDLYEKNFENTNFLAFVDDVEHTITFDLELTKELFSQNIYELEENEEVEDAIDFNYTVDELAEILKESYTSNTEKVVAIHLFGIKYGKYIRKNNLNVKEIINKSTISESYFVELNKGIKLSSYVGIINVNKEPEENNDNDEEYEINDEEGIIPTRHPRTEFIHPLNTIIYGAPGTGKTYFTFNYAMAIIEKRKIDKDESRESLMIKYKNKLKSGQIVFTTFHQSYGYEDFIQGIRPDPLSESLKLTPVNGVFKKIAHNALMDPDNNYVIIIDEINRANISKVLGELITLIEEDKRWGESNQLQITLPSGEAFVVPNNLYIVGTMNTADKSIALIDMALRRRFDFVEQPVVVDLVSEPTLKNVLEKINTELTSEFESTDLLIGHAYFMNKKEEDLVNLMNQKIIPLLYEYFSDNYAKVKIILDKALEGKNFKVSKSSNTRLKIEENVETNA